MIKLSPSDFAFLWEQCKRCFYLKVVQGIRQPSMPMAAIFKRLEGLQMKFYDGRRTTDLLPELPPGIIRCGERVVESEPGQVEGQPEWFIYGKIDSLIEFDDGSWGILDFKTTTVTPEKGQLYGRQLHAYAHAFEHPASAPRILKGQAPGLSPISKLGILCFEPGELLLESPGRQAYKGQVQWIEIPRNPEQFLSFVGETLKVLKGQIPAPTPSCDWCTYAATMKDIKAGPAAKEGVASGPRCPKCDSPMTQRTGKFGAFWGCTRYPECKGTRRTGE
jgi:hypothetical protein